LGAENKGVFYTTGVWAAAAAKGAVLELLGWSPKEVDVKIPTGQRVTLPILQTAMIGESGWAQVVKEGGEAQDVTNGLVIEATARFSSKGLIILGGRGVGRVTRKGLKVPVGEPAINPVPRVLILRSIGEVLARHSLSQGVEVVIEVPRGEEIAPETANPRIGIVGGISILGTRGTVVPYSTRSFLDSIRVELEVARAQGLTEVVLSPGRSSRERAMVLLPHLPPFAFVEMGDFVGFAAKTAGDLGFSLLHLVAQPGKMAKIAMGFKNTHARRHRMEMKRLAEMLGVPEVAGMNTAREAYLSLKNSDWSKVSGLAAENLSRWAGGVTVLSHLLPPE
jgi:cobalt-precorrin-5B (C1)-methyltransferase